MLSSVEDELQEMARSSAYMASKIGGALAALSQHGEKQSEAIANILSALQKVQQMEFRYQGLALAVRQYALLPADACTEVHSQIWQSAGLEEVLDESDSLLLQSRVCDIEALSPRGL